ncbi:non-ribosomal peptide synthetase [Flavobacterium poyangense]|uniref:non-ribosomal peptide synthetase n=1 Tax=Flavobacterium poyangense TaxID=2204302 RepID=UPI001421902C|nr:non-ribosomal peptide synthetase [Flavobacterium sp. JXAS1]
MKNLLKELRENEIYISLDGEDLKLKFNQQEIPQELISRIRKDKEALVLYLKEQITASDTELAIAPAPVSVDGYELSSSQQRLWVLDQFEEGLASYNITHQAELKGDYDIKLFQDAVFAVIERHEILRTVFKKNSKGQIAQWVLNSDEVDFFIGYEDFSNEDQPMNAVSSYITEDKAKTFNLEKGPLLRAAILKTSSDQYVFHYNMHHIIGDGWSMGVLANDVMAFYKAFTTKEKVQLAPLSIQYKDYAANQVKELNKPEKQGHKKYWSEVLSGELPIIDLPSSTTRPPVKTQNGNTLEVYLSSELTTALKFFTKEQEGSLFISLLALWNALVYRYTGQDDLIMGTPVAGRNHIDLENQIGFYVNTLVLRNKINPEDDFLTHYKKTKEQVLGAFSHQEYPFDQILNDLNTKRDISRSAIFDMMIALQNTGEKIKEVYAIETNTIVDKGEELSKMDLEINFAEIGDKLLFKLNYNTDIYSKVTISGLMKHFIQLAENSILTPNVPVKSLNYLSTSEKSLLINLFNKTEVPFPNEKTIIDLFSEQALKYPERIALTYENFSYTYKELDELSNQLSHYLIDNYVIQQEDLIGLLVERSQWVVIGILAILKTGAAYLPLGIDYPTERLNYIKKDSGIKVCIDAEVLAKFEKEKDKFAKTGLDKKINPNNLAYVIYTSGTTGNPKGTLIEHRNVVRLFYNRDFQFDFNENDVWCLFHSYYFDFSVWEIFGALLFGGKVAVVTKEDTKDFNAFANFISEQGVTVLNQTPTAFKHLQKIVLASDKSFRTRYLIFGGEALMTSSVRTWKNQFPDCKIINMYGITETTVHVTYKEITKKEIDSIESNIGQPIPTLGCVVLDKFQQIVPFGVVGELHVYGEGLARAYLNNKELTDTKFVTQEIESIGNVRLYKTGDLVKWSETGDLIYLGRKDNQVKIRGHRIELEEIEHYLIEKEDIEEVKVIVNKNNESENELIAYFVSGKTQNTSDLRKYLAARIPDYAIPSYFVQLNGFPLTSNGKISHKDLPDPKDYKVATNENYAAARNETEQKLVEILAKELERSQQEVGIHDNFFDLGANSIKLIKILNEINTQLNTTIKPVLLFQYATISDLVEHVFHQSEEEDEMEKASFSDEIDEIIDFL